MMNLVSISAFKTKMRQDFQDTILAAVIESEPEEMVVEEFLFKAPTWMALARVKK